MKETRKTKTERKEIKFVFLLKQTGIFNECANIEMSMKARMLTIRLNERISLTERKIILHAKF